MTRPVPPRRAIPQEKSPSIITILVALSATTYAREPAGMIRTDDRELIDMIFAQA